MEIFNIEQQAKNIKKAGQQQSSAFFVTIYRHCDNTKYHMKNKNVRK